MNVLAQCIPVRLDPEKGDGDTFSKGLWGTFRTGQLLRDAHLLSSAGLQFGQELNCTDYMPLGWCQPIVWNCYHCINGM